jgi:hypothetical protein
MKGDFTRSTFNSASHISRVLMQQGRVLLDADWNDSTDVILHYLRSLTTDLVGPRWAPGTSFLLKNAKKASEKLIITKGHYYIDGILCENEADVAYTAQPDYPRVPNILGGHVCLVYLHVWERHITYVQDDRIRERALGGPDTATRAKVVWQVELIDKMPDGSDIVAGAGGISFATVERDWNDWIERWQPVNRGRLQARAKVASKSLDPCTISPDARFRGTENRLYRVEIHTGGKVGTATFKFSRNNGCDVYAIRRLAGKVATVEHLGVDDRSRLQRGDWVEIIDDADELHGKPGELRQVDAVDPLEMTVTFRESTSSSRSYEESNRDHPLLRRWDHQSGDESQGELKTADDGALPVKEGTWITLEDGVQIFFEPVSDPTPMNAAHKYRTGDYWWIPSRVATSDIEWPMDGNKPRALRPHGVEHHYAPLGIVKVDNGGAVTVSETREPPK